MKKVYEELIERKQYLKEENPSPNVGEFKYGNSKNIDTILKGVNAYRYDIYKLPKKTGRIKSLGGGDPIKYKTYKYIKKDIKNYLKQDNLNEYPYTEGSKGIKNILIDYLNSINIKNINLNEMLLTPSTTYAYTLLLKSIVRKYDVILIPTPTYGLFVYGPEKIGGTVEYIELKEDKGWTIDLDELENTINRINKELKEKYMNLNYTPRVVAIYHQNPNNPLGISLGKEAEKYLKNLAKVCDKNNVLIIDDLVYRESVYDNNKLALPIASFKKYRDNVVTLLGISKSYSLAGIRAGIAVGNKYIIQDMRDNMFVQMDSVSMITQISLASIYNTNKKKVKYRNKFLEKIHNKYLYNLDIVRYFVEGSNSINNKNKKKIEKQLSKEEIRKYKNGMTDVSIYHNMIPESGFFILLDFTKIKGKKIVDKPIKNDIDLILELFKKDKIKFLPGSSFCWNNKNDIIGRITFSKSSDLLIEDMKSLASIMNNLKK